MATNITVMATTDEPAVLRVRYGLTADYELGTVAGSQPTLSHSVLLIDLLPETAYYLEVVATDNAGNSSQPDLLTVTTDAQGQQATIISDEFNATELDTTVWTFIDPVGDSVLTVDGTHARISVPLGSEHDIWTHGVRAPRLMQTVDDGDFAVEAKFDAVPNGDIATTGIFVESDADTFIRFEVYSTAAGLQVFCATFDNLAPTVRVNQSIPAVTAGSLYLRVARVGDEWTYSYSPDGVGWQEAARFTYAPSVTGVGLMTGNAFGSTSPAFTSLIDYFRNLV